MSLGPFHHLVVEGVSAQAFMAQWHPTRCDQMESDTTIAVLHFVGFPSIWTSPQEPAGHQPVQAAAMVRCPPKKGGDL